MKLAFTPPNDDQVHTYCMKCGREGDVSSRRVNGSLTYHCSCGHQGPRALIIDPAIEWWVDAKQEYWHKTAGVFAMNETGQFLFFKRRNHPSGLTVPAGHVDKGEKSLVTAQREFFEEANAKISLNSLSSIAVDNILGDECRRGADAHRWYTFATHINTSQIRISQAEGMKPVWLTLDDALKHDLTFAVRYIISRHARTIEKAVK